jgi:TRAP transporter TAXI family solute receptor
MARQTPDARVCPQTWRMLWRDGAAALATGWPLALVIILGFAAAFQFVEPAPPRHLVITTGKEDGAYYEFAKRYQEILARDGITLEILTSEGSGENLRRLRQGEAQIGFVQGGGWPQEKKGKEPYFLDSLARMDFANLVARKDEGLYTIGSAFYEPIWVFARSQTPLGRLTQLEGKRIAVAQESNDAKALAYRLLEANEIGNIERDLISLNSLQAAEELQQGRLDALFVVAAPEAMVVQVLLRSPGVQLMSFSQAEAYRRQFPFLSRLTMPEGGVDLVRDYPPQDTELLAATANLVIRSDMHPALQTLMLGAMREVHGGSGYFQRQDEFPAYKDSDFPLSSIARRFYDSGPPFLQRYMPFWLAVLADRFLILALPLFTLLFPLLRLAPAFYNWRIRSRICGCYGELGFLENDIRQYHEQDLAVPEQYAALCRRLDDIENAAGKLSIPMRFADMRYTLREHINLVRRMLERREQDNAASSPSLHVKPNI